MNKRRIRIVHDESPESPREWCNLGEMVCWHPRYKLGDRQVPGPDYAEGIGAPEEGSVVLALYLADHGGITVSTAPFSCPFDSGVVGYIAVSEMRIRQEYGDDSPESRAKAEAALRAEVEVYDHYLTGNVWGYVIEEITTCNLGHEHAEEVDSCWGFYGDDFGLDDIAAHADMPTDAVKAAWEARY